MKTRNIYNPKQSSTSQDFMFSDLHLTTQRNSQVNSKLKINRKF